MRIDALRIYMFTILDELLNRQDYQINADFLDNNAENYSLNRIPVEPIIEQWITGYTRKQEVYDFVSRRTYSADVDNNLQNIGFYEEFEKKILDNNKNGILPNIQGISSIECLNCGALSIAGTDDCMFSIQIRIIYEEDE